MRSLKELAEQATADSRRADVLRSTIRTVGDHHGAVQIDFDLTFRGSPGAYYEMQEVVDTIKRLWPTIWAETMRASQAELEEIEKRYAPLLYGDEESSP